MNAAARSITRSRAATQAWWLGRARTAAANAAWLARMLASWEHGLGAMPDGLGLEPDEFRALIDTNFRPPTRPLTAPRRTPADFSGMPEKDDLESFLLTHAAPGDRRERAWMARILVAGCLGRDHLWQDLGLGSRGDLTALINHNFPAIQRMNQHNMRWKKFLYKQLCEAEGIHVCRSPSCGECVDYADCFPTALLLPGTGNPTDLDDI
jgi:nitrogen fixation protein NifQ